MKAYNPLEKRNLAESVVQELLDTTVTPLEDLTRFEGAGVYAIYYTGDFKPYAPYRNDATKDVYDKPIYVGKAVPTGARTGGVGIGKASSKNLSKRLNEHLKSVKEVENLDGKDFYFRYLIVDDIWIPLAETLLIENFRPAWNVKIPGFGIHSPGSGRKGQKRSDWDTVHPGRSYAKGLQVSPLSPDQILARLKEPDTMVAPDEIET